MFILKQSFTFHSNCHQGQGGDHLNEMSNYVIMEAEEKHTHLKELKISVVKVKKFSVNDNQLSG